MYHDHPLDTWDNAVFEKENVCTMNWEDISTASTKPF
jgi:hypothetical protein